MTSTWGKMIVLQILITAVTYSTELDPEDNSKISNENIILLFNKFLENIYNQHAIEKSTDKVEEIKNFYRPSLNYKQNIAKSTENEMRNVELQQLTFDNLENVNINGNLNNKRTKKHYVTTLCRFKICNRKKSMDDYDNFIRYATINQQY